VVILGLVTLAVTLPRWRRRTRARAGDPAPEPPELDPAESERLDADLARHL
jgi:hypothetical protein